MAAGNRNKNHFFLVQKYTSTFSTGHYNSGGLMPYPWKFCQIDRILRYFFKTAKVGLDVPCKYLGINFVFLIVCIFFPPSKQNFRRCLDFSFAQKFVLQSAINSTEKKKTADIKIRRHEWILYRTLWMTFWRVITSSNHNSHYLIKNNKKKSKQ